MQQIEQRFLQRLQEMKAQYAKEALTKPAEKSEFGYGEAVGTYRGFLLVEQLFNEVIGEDRDRT